MSSGRCRNFVVSSRKPSPRIRRKIEVLPTSLLPLKATLYTGNVLFTPSAILPIFPTENHQHISEETMAMKVLWLTPSIRHVKRKYANISSSPWSRACEAARPQSCSSSWTEKAYQNLGYISSSHCDVHLHERFVVWWTTVWTVKIYCRDHEGNWIHAVVLLLTVRISFCFLQWFVWQKFSI